MLSPNEVPPKLRVLLVEDDPLAAIGLRFLIGNLGHQVIAEARTGDEAIQQAESNQPDVILMDIRMPGRNGIEATEMILAKGPVPIILITAYHDEDTIRRAYQAGATAYLVKPISEYELKATLRAIYDRGSPV